MFFNWHPPRPDEERQGTRYPRKLEGAFARDAGPLSSTSNAPAMIAPADVALAAFHLSRYVRSEAEKAA
jgi:hypothetical protein